MDDAHSRAGKYKYNPTQQFIIISSFGTAIALAVAGSNSVAENEGNPTVITAYEFSRQLAGLASLIIAATCLAAAVGPAVTGPIA